MFLRQEILRDLKEAERDLSLTAGGAGQTFTWNGVEIPCIPSTLKRGTQIQIGPSFYDVEFTLLVRYTHFITGDDDIAEPDEGAADSDLPHPWTGRTLVFRGWTYRVAATRVSVNLTHYELDLIDPNSGR